MSFRIQKVNSLIKKEIGEIFTCELDMKPAVFLTVAKVDTTKDLRYTHIFVSVFPEKESNYVEVTLKNEKNNIQKKLNKRLQIKILPKITFKLDTTEAEADKIEKILRTL